LKSLILLLPFALLLGCKTEEEFKELDCGTETVKYHRQEYNTVQIGDQCWLKENLNVGTMIQGYEEQSDNGTIEKYCQNDDRDSCLKFGGLYQWDEMMQYTDQEGVKGICPQGWHLPTDKEWEVLEGAVDSRYGIGDTTWEGYEYRGYDAGTNLKTTSGWDYGGNGTDLFGFSGLPGGDRYFNGYLCNVGNDGYWWTSTEDYYFNFAWARCLNFDHPEVLRYYYSEGIGFSVRCLKD